MLSLLLVISLHFGKWFSRECWLIYSGLFDALFIIAIVLFFFLLKENIIECFIFWVYRVFKSRGWGWGRKGFESRTNQPWMLCGGSGIDSLLVISLSFYLSKRICCVLFLHPLLKSKVKLLNFAAISCQCSFLECIFIFWFICFSGF